MAVNVPRFLVQLQTLSKKLGLSNESQKNCKRNGSNGIGTISQLMASSLQHISMENQNCKMKKKNCVIKLGNTCPVTISQLNLHEILLRTIFFSILRRDTFCQFLPRINCSCRICTKSAQQSREIHYAK